MRTYTIHRVATRRRLAWLRECGAHAPADRAGWHHTPYHCARLGWTQWVFLGDEIVGEELTDEGRTVLAGAKEDWPMERTVFDLDRFLAEYDVDDNVWWTLSTGEMQNMFDALLARYQEIDLKCERLEEQVENWRDAYTEAKKFEAQREEMFLAELAKTNAK